MGFGDKEAQRKWCSHL